MPEAPPMITVFFTILLRLVSFIKWVIGIACAVSTKKRGGIAYGLMEGYS
jgi:hypothetical protein